MRPCKPSFLAILVFLIFVLAPARARGDSGISLTLTPPPSWDWASPCTVTCGRQGLNLDQLFLATDLWGYNVGAGFKPIDWGPSPGEDLVFGGLAGLAQIRLAASYSGFAILPPMDYENFYAYLPPRGGSGRLLIGRRYTTDWSEDRWTLGLTEVALLSGDYSPYYLIPYPFFPLSVGKVFISETRTGDKHDANLLYGLDLAYRNKGLTAYASLLVDEAPLTAAWAGPWRVGTQIGVVRKKVWGHDDLEIWAEYTGISRYAYDGNDGYARCDFRAGDRPLGHSLGQDADLLRGRLTKDTSVGRTWLEVARARRGEGGSGARWTPADGQVCAFLTGIVETEYWLSGGCAFPLGDLAVTAEAGGARVINRDNRAGATGWNGKFSVGLVYAF